MFDEPYGDSSEATIVRLSTMPKLFLRLTMSRLNPNGKPKPAAMADELAVGAYGALGSNPSESASIVMAVMGAILPVGDRSGTLSVRAEMPLDSQSMFCPPGSAIESPRAWTGIVSPLRYDENRVDSWASAAGLSV